MKDNATTPSAEAIERSCNEKRNKVYNSAVLLTIDENSFVWDIRQYRSGLFIIEKCESAINEPTPYSRHCLDIFEDECAFFVPCDEFLRLSEAVDKMIAPLLCEEPTF